MAERWWPLVIRVHSAFAQGGPRVRLGGQALGGLVSQKRSLASLAALMVMVVGLIVATLPNASYADTPPTFTLDGQLMNAAGTAPHQDSNVRIRVQILDPSKTCILYDEEHTGVNTTDKGRFSLQIGSPVSGPSSLKRADRDSGNSVAHVFQNRFTINGRLAGGAGCSHSPLAGTERYARLIVTRSGGTAEALSPDMALNSVPNAQVAQTIQGFGPDDLLRVNAGLGMNQATLETMFTGGSTHYAKQSASGASLLPSFPTASPPASPVAGDVWFDSDANVIKFWDGSSAQTLGTTGAVSGDAITSGTIGGTTALNTSGNLVTSGSIQGASGTFSGSVSVGSLTSSGSLSAASVTATGAVTANSVLSRSLLLFDQDTSPNEHKVTLAVPASIPTDYALTLPPAAGSAGQILVVDEAGQLSWMTPSAGTVTGVSSTNPYLTVGGTAAAPTLTLNVGDTPNTVAAGDDARIVGALQSADYNTDVAGATSCLASEKPYWNGVSDQWMCAAIGNLDASAITSGTIDRARLGSGSADNTTYLRGDGSWAAIPAAGETNTASNQGAAGVGVFDTKAAVDLQFRNINSGSNKVSVALDGPNKEIDIDINEANLDLGNIGGSLNVNAITGTLPVAKGGTGSSAALVNNRLMVSSGGSIVEHSAVTASSALISDANGLPSASSVTATELGYLSGVTSNVQTQLSTVSTSLGDKVNRAGDTMTGALNLPANGLTVGTDQLVVSGGSVGIGTTTPQTRLDVAGAVKVGADANACDGTKTGAIRLNGSVLEFCNSSAWTVLATGANTISGSGTTNAVPKFTAAGTIGDSAIVDDGNNIVASRAIASSTNEIASGASIDLKASNTHTLADVGGSTITISNPTNGGVYNIVIEDTTSRAYTFSGCTTTYFKPANGATQTGTRSIYGLMTIQKGANWDCYVTWSTGFAP